MGERLNLIQTICGAARRSSRVKATNNLANSVFRIDCFIRLNPTTQSGIRFYPPASPVSPCTQRYVGVESRIYVYTDTYIQREDNAGNKFNRTTERDIFLTEGGRVDFV